MLIGIEAERANHPQPSGVEHYAANLIRELDQLPTAHRFRLYLRTPPLPWLQELPHERFELRVLPFPVAWTQVRLSWEFVRRPPDVLHIPASALPFIHPRRSVTTIHDTAWRHYPQAFTPSMRRYLEGSTRFAVRNARAIITVSEATKRDLVEGFHVPADRVHVVPLGVSQAFRVVEPSEAAPILEQHSLEYGNYFLHVGVLQPRKNIPLLIAAYRSARETERALPPLVLIGKPGWLAEPILQAIREARDHNVRYLDYVPTDQLPIFYSGARASFLVSAYEGFGLPVLEAMACGSPMIISDTSSLPEVAREAAVRVPPNDVESLRAAILRVNQDDALRNDLREKGSVRACEFSWSRCARETLAVYEQT